MFLHLNNTDHVFKSIRTATLVIVVLYIIFCCYLISLNYPAAPGQAKKTFSASMAVRSNVAAIEVSCNLIPESRLCSWRRSAY